MRKKRAGWLDVGDKVRVRMMSGKPGPTLYEVATVDHDSGFCTIREINPAQPDVKYRAQEFDTSLLMLERSGGHAKVFEEYLNRPFTRRRS